MRLRRADLVPFLAVSAVASVVGLGACVSSPSGPCLGTANETVSVPFERLVKVSHEVAGDTSAVRFEFDREVPGSTTVTAGPAQGPYGLFPTGEVLDDVLGDHDTRVVMDGLVGGASTDRIRSDGPEPYRVREVVQVIEDDAFGWIIGTAGRSCLRLRSDPGTGSVVILVSPEAS
jgi:hypothetical protein